MKALCPLLLTRHVRARAWGDKKHWGCRTGTGLAEASSLPPSILTSGPAATHALQEAIIKSCLPEDVYKVDIGVMDKVRAKIEKWCAGGSTGARGLWGRVPEYGGPVTLPSRAAVGSFVFFVLQQRAWLAAHELGCLRWLPTSSAGHAVPLDSRGDCPPLTDVGPLLAIGRLNGPCVLIISLGFPLSPLHSACSLKRLCCCSAVQAMHAHHRSCLPLRARTLRYNLIKKTWFALVMLDGMESTPQQGTRACTQLLQGTRSFLHMHMRTGNPDTYTHTHTHTNKHSFVRL